MSGLNTYKYYIIHKPYGMLSQFTREGNNLALADLDFDFPKDIYPVGRLDADSEGLLILTNDNFLKTKLLDPKNRHFRTYYVQVDGQVTEEAIRQLEKGVEISVNGKKYKTLPCKATEIANPNFEERTPPVRFRANIPTSWISVSLHEGKNRQVRKMTAAVGFPTLRLVRVSIEKLQLANLPIGQCQEISKKELLEKVFR